MRGFGVALLALACTSCWHDQEIASTCEAMAQHRRDCGFTDDGVWCQELADYHLTEPQRQETLCILDCNQQATCEEVALDVCADVSAHDTPIQECAWDCAELSDFLLILPAPAECPTAPSD